MEPGWSAGPTVGLAQGSRWRAALQSAGQPFSLADSHAKLFHTPLMLMRRLRFLRSQTYRQAKDRATALAAGAVGPKLGCPVEITVGAIDQGRVRQLAIRAVEGEQSGQRAAWGDLENRASVADAVPARGPVEVPVRALDQGCAGSGSVPAAEAMQRGQRASGSDFEDRAPEVGVGPSKARCPVEVSIGALDQPREAEFTVGAVETVQNGQRAGWGDLEDRAKSWIVGSAPARCPIKVPVSGLDQWRKGVETTRLV